ERKRGFRFALPDFQRAERMIGFGIIRLGYQDTTKQPLRAVDAPGLEMGQALTNRLVDGTSACIHPRGCNRSGTIPVFLIIDSPRSSHTMPATCPGKRLPCRR